MAEPREYTFGMLITRNNNQEIASSTLRRIIMRNIAVGALLAAAMALPGCATNTNLSTSPTLPAAQGSVRYSVTKNNNTRIALRVRHLAHPEKLTPPTDGYVVWTRETKDAPPQNIGALIVDKNLNGSLDAETPLHSFELFITAESSSQVKLPLGPPLLWTDYSR
jgi:hypothetical protein